VGVANQSPDVSKACRAKIVKESQRRNVMGKNRFFQGAVILLALVLASVACSFNFSTANVENVRMARDPDGADATNQFNPQDDFYLVGELNNAPDDTTLKVIWTAVEVEGVDANTVIQEYEEAGGDGPFWFQLSSNSGIWPPGRYKADLYLNDELNTTQEFEVISG
jgi:hypothetical protein